jgi:hypothetical protein
LCLFLSHLKLTVIDLLYIEYNGNSHYCLIKDLDSFRCDKNKHKQFTCRNCLQGFQRKETLERHKELCLNQKHCNLILPDKDKNILEFTKHEYCSKLPVIIYCDFEGSNIPLEISQSDPSQSYTKKIFKQEVNSYGIYVKSDYSNIYKSEYISYVGEDAKEKFVKKIIQIYNKITYNRYIHEQKDPILSKQEEDEFQETTECYICNGEFKIHFLK